MAAPCLSLPHPAGTFLSWTWPGPLRLGLVELIFAFFFVDLFDNVGTLVGVCEQGRIPARGETAAGGAALSRRCGGYNVRRRHRHVNRDELHRKRSGVAAGARTGFGNLLIAALFLVRDILFAARQRNPDLCDGAGADPGRAPDVQSRCACTVG